ncbi:MAG: glutamate--tRNA ligase [Bacteroidetes bacterium]|nr:glutamate--tRNA ligase [Bacteroidota bacterium]
MSVRVRFAPSPTGYLHVGGLRTALYNYLFAKKNGGKFILRIEDTDRTRFVPGAMENLVETLRWSGLDFDEGPGVGGPHGPYIQSERTALYQEMGRKLLEDGHAYKCFCTAERLDEMRLIQQKLGQPPRYDKLCEHLTPADIREKEAAGLPYVVRMKVPERPVRFTDLIRGLIEITPENIDDQVLLKSDGFPTYHLANVVDDHDMQITHVIRGEEWLPSTPKHILLYQYFGWQPPQFAHLPLLLNADRSKLSKRQGDVAVEDYRAKGYEKEALINFVAFLGWNPGEEREIFSLGDLASVFTLDRVGKAGAIFNIDKLNWMNQQHIRLKSGQQLLVPLKSRFLEAGYSAPDEYLIKVIDLLKDRVNFLHDFVQFSKPFFSDPDRYDEETIQKKWTPDTVLHLTGLKATFSAVSDFSHQQLEDALKVYAEQAGIKPGSLVQPLRIVISGESSGPALYTMMEMLGKATCLGRMDKALSAIKVAQVKP